MPFLLYVDDSITFAYFCLIVFHYFPRPPTCINDGDS